MVNINLLPQEIVQKQKFKELLSLIILSASLIGIILISIYILQVITLMNLNSQLVSIQRQLKELEPIVKEVEQLKKIKSELESKKQLVEQLLSCGLVYPKFMSDLLKVLPEDVWLSNLSANIVRDPATNMISALDVKLICSSYDKFSIADFLSNLENFDKFKDVKLGAINISQQDKYELHSFTVDFKYIVK
jgi:Tfp pilus assembly protein PilN